jgi:hypothetical protein
MSKLIQNAIFNSNDGKWHLSRHSWDLVPFEVSDGTSLFIDGGNEYQRKNFDIHPEIQDWCLYEESERSLIKERLLWGTYGKNGDQPRTWVPLSKCEDDHLQAILRTQLHIGSKIKSLIVELLKDRGIEAELPPHYTTYLEVEKSLEISTVE